MLWCPNCQKTVLEIREVTEQKEYRIEKAVCPVCFVTLFALRQLIKKLLDKT